MTINLHIGARPCGRRPSKGGGRLGCDPQPGRLYSREVALNE